uniref:Complex 1 LYR protein domain-containing protein n=1 Tax=Meloidogyne javanica TaxID=6303 RepID=A0A915MXF5_MELJA
MIISNDFRLHFYEELRKDHILIIVNADVDALCATAILTVRSDGEEGEENGGVEELLDENDQQSHQDERNSSIIKRRGKRKQLAYIIASRTLKRQRRTQWKRARGTILWEYYLKVPLGIEPESSVVNYYSTAEYLNKTFASFNTNFGFNSTYNAVDFARILTIRLEWNQSDKPDSELSRRFESTNEILREFFKTGGRELPPLKHSVELYKMALKSLNELVKRSIAQKHVVLMSRFFLLSLSDQNPTSRGTKPFILIFPLLGEHSGWYLISGLMPLVEIMADTSGKSVIGSAFKHVAREANIEIRHTFDSNGSKMAALPVRADWLKLYKELLRAGREFPQYSYKHFARRRVRDYFEHSRTENLSESRLVEMYELAIRRQALISTLYPYRPLAVENRNK